MQVRRAQDELIRAASDEPRRRARVMTGGSVSRGAVRRRSSGLIVAIAPQPDAPHAPERPELAALGDDALRFALSQMHLIRKFEETAEASYMRGLIHGTMHLSIGQEASAVGATLPLARDDYILVDASRPRPLHRRKAPIRRACSPEFFGKENGYCRGRGGSMHIADIEGGNLAPTASSPADCRSPSASA